MNEKIALGFHTCVDYELKWDTTIVEKMIVDLGIHADELRTDMEVDSERAVWVLCLVHLAEGAGCEMVPSESGICVDFAEHFRYRVTLGGTPTRAAIILDRLGYKSILQTSCYNKYVKTLMPDRVRVLPGMSSEHRAIYPHVVLQCQKGVRIHANDIDFITPRENRILISRDEDSLNLPVLAEKFGDMIKECEVFLLGSFTEILDFEVLKDRMEKTKKLLTFLPKDATVVMEDGCYVKSDFRKYVHEQLAERVVLLSMNEDEMQQYIGKRIDILDPKEVRESVEEIYRKSGFQNILIHSAAWALVYGERAETFHDSLEGGVTMAATRFRIGDDFTTEDYDQTKDISDNEKSIVFCNKIKELLGEKIDCIPCKDLSFVEDPTVVGLGDSFAGGLLPGLLKKSKI